ncbi:NUC173 domain protein [Babesia caballi]|uniref:NUC173 domain protein n=1 Tax=Babesia caballi TaxID=5871 RepID=A0AAV4LXV2_BABCB|nr:NUC173 domain protein [Babesia caballi]
MVAQEAVSQIVANLINRIKRSTALGYDAVADSIHTVIEEEDVVIYEEHVGSGRFEGVKQSAFDSLVLIRSAVAPVDLDVNLNLSETDRQALRELYPIVKCAVDCVAQQLDEAIRNAAKRRDPDEDTSTITFEGLFLIAKTGLEMLNPVVFTVEREIFGTMVDVLDRAAPLRQLMKACGSCLTTYVCRLLASDFPVEGDEGLTVTVGRLKHMFERALSLAIAADGNHLNSDAVSMLKMVITAMNRRLGKFSGEGQARPGNAQLTFVTRVVDCWYGVLVTKIMQLRSEMLQSTSKPVRLGKLMRLITTLPPLPPAHRLRLVIQVALTLRQDATCVMQTETLSALTALMDLDARHSGEIVRGNMRTLSEALVEVLFDRRFCGNSHGATDKTDCEKQVQLVYCIAQCIRTARSVPRDDGQPGIVDEFLQKQILTLLNTESGGNSDSNARVERLMRETQDLPELHSDFPTLEDFMASRDDCQLLTRLARTFEYLFSYSNQDLDEAIALVMCWLFTEFDFVLCLKILTPLCLHFLRTKRSRMLDGLYNVNHTVNGIASVAQAATRRWAMGGKIFAIALESYNKKQGREGMGLDASDASQAEAIFAALLASTVDIAKEMAGIIPKDLEDCLGLYVKTFGFQEYLRLMPLEPLYAIPITSASYRTDSGVYMLPVLQRQLKGAPLEVYLKHFMPTLRHVEALKAKVMECAAIDTTGDATMTHAARSYDSVVSSLYNILVAMVTGAPDCKASLEANDFELLKHVLWLLDCGVESTIVACRVIASCSDLSGVAPRLIGLLVKRFVALEMTFHTEGSDMQAAMHSVEDALLAAIANCGRFCDSAMLAENLTSFEAALVRGQGNVVPLIKISRALLPSVDDELKLKMHRHWLVLSKREPAKNVYLALKRSCETLAAEIKKAFPLRDRSAPSAIPEPVVEASSVYVKEACCVDGLLVLSEALHLSSESKATEETEEHAKHRIACIGAFARLLETMKEQGVYGSATKKFAETLIKPLVVDAMVNASAPNNNTRSSALGIYDSVCNLKLEEIGDVLKLTVLPLSSKSSKSMQIVLVRCLSRLLARHSQHAMKYNLTQVLTFTFRMLAEDNLKLYIQLMKFARVCIVKLSWDRVQWLAPLLMRMFDNESCCQKAKVYVRRVVQKLMVKLTRDQMMKIFPPAHLPLLRSIMAAQRKKRNSKLRKVLKPADDEEDDDEAFIDNMFKTDEEGRLVITMEEGDEPPSAERSVVAASVQRKQRKSQSKLQRKGSVQPYTYIKLNKAKTAEKHKRENIKTLKSLVKTKSK